ncbi:MAG: DUF748 domain-containing protein, partial [Desulfuromonadales bacterium]|nr:DUF748 domain-containing protein [Desulfuromonadales bacterium]
MTNHAPPKKPRKSLQLLSVLAVTILAVGWVTYFLVNFDLNDYRQQIEKNLSALLSLPVKVGDIHYNLNGTNLALHVAELQIGDIGTAVQVDASSVMLNLQWRGLLKRDFKFTKISLAQPQLWVRRTINMQADGENLQITPIPTIIDQALLDKISINDLEIIGGTIHIETAHPDQPAQQIVITKVDGELSDLRLSQAVQLSMQGDLSIPGQKGKSSWQLQGESSLELDEDNVLEPHFDLDLSLKNLKLSAVRNLFSEHLAGFAIKGSGDLRLHMARSSDRSIDFQTGLSSNNIELLPSPAYANPIRFKKLLVSGQLQTHGNHPGIDNFSLQIDETLLTGSIGWSSVEKPFSATVTLLDSILTVSQIKQWVPDDQEPVGAIQQNLRNQGSLQIEQAEFILFEGEKSQKEWRVDQLQGELQKIALDLEEGPTVEIISLPFNFADNLWQINNGRGKLGSQQIAVNGTGGYDKGDIVFTSLDLSSDIIPSKLLEEWHISPQHSLSTDGTVGFSGHIEGSLDQLSVDLQANLSQFNISHPAGWTITPGSEDKLTLHGTLTPQKFSLDHGALKWSVLKGHLSGSYNKQNPDSLMIDTLLTINNLARLTEVLPILEKWQLRGQADLRISQRGPPENSRPEMTLTLRDAGLKATRVIADLNQINGRAQVTTSGLVAENLRVHIGESPLTVQARIEDFANPQLILDATAPSIRADDLIFHSDKSILRDINGHLEIDKDGLSFAPVDVRLDGGTDAAVRGTISFHPPYAVQLDITSEFARISEVISLWSDRSETSKKRSDTVKYKIEDTTDQTPIRINASVKTGDLYGMSFHDATAVIVPTHNRLSIHPLDLSVGEGFCNAQVITDFSTNKPTLLRISGHAQDVDALEVYRELLNQKNIVRGKLRGDFYLSGEIGSNRSRHAV